MRRDVLIILLLVLLLVGIGPWWPYMHGGYWPGGLVGLVLLVLLIRLIA